jgi:hypothetical protein
MTCSLRVSVYANETSTALLWLGDACVRCRKPLGFDGVVLFCREHDAEASEETGAFHSIHKTCLDGEPLRSVPLGSPPVLLREVLQLSMFKE